MDVLAYLRVSTDEQGRSGLGVAAQRSAIEREADRRGWTVVEWVADDGYSGKSLNRPGIVRCLEMAQPIEMPWRSAATDHFQPSLARSVGLAPVPSPP
jgi:DNA invertase Pin-like site-specific DNA recombinase